MKIAQALFLGVSVAFGATILLSAEPAAAASADERVAVAVAACADSECTPKTGWQCWVAIPGGWSINFNCKPDETFTASGSGEADGADCVLGFAPGEAIPTVLKEELARKEGK